MRRGLLLLLLPLWLSACSSNPALVQAAGYNRQLGLAYLQQGDRPRAQRKLLLALDQAPQDPATQAAMAYFMEQSGESAQAEVYYQRALRFSTHSGAQCNNYGAFLCRMRHYTEAEAYFLRAVEDPRYDQPAAALENAGFCALAAGDQQKAQVFFSKALARDPSRQQALREWTKLKANHRSQHEHNRHNGR